VISKPIHAGDHIQIENIPRMQWGQNTENSFIRSSQLTLNALGESFTYPFIMGISGAAFRFQFHPDWCPSASDATAGFDVSKKLFNSLGYKTELIKIDDGRFTEIQRLYTKIIEQINKGYPIIANNLKVCPEWGIITGYVRTKPGIICRTCFDEGDEYSLAEHAPWLSYFIREREKEPLDTKTLFFNSLAIAIKLAKTDYFGDYASGLKAFQVWIDHISGYIQNNKRFDQIQVNLSLINILIDARISAVNYLGEMVNRYPIKSGLIIINNYLKELQLLQELHTDILPVFNDHPSVWTSDILTRHVHILKGVMKLEFETLELLEEALNSN